jgi:hypothetical protein
MQAAIKALRQLADECESRAKAAADHESKLNLVLLGTDCHWLAGKADQSATEHMDRVVWGTRPPQFAASSMLRRLSVWRTANVNSRF